MSAKHPLTLYREKQKLTITALAGLLGVSKATVSRWEDGRLPDQKLWPVIKEKTNILPQALARFTAEASE